MTIVRCLTPNATDTDSDINVYEVRHADGQHDVMASDNGSVWLVGDEDDADVNKSQFLAIAAANGESVEWDEIKDCDLREWVADRRNESDSFRRADECGETRDKGGAKWNKKS